MTWAAPPLHSNVPPSIARYRCTAQCPRYWGSKTTSQLLLMPQEVAYVLANVKCQLPHTKPLHRSVAPAHAAVPGSSLPSLQSQKSSLTAEAGSVADLT